MFVVAVVVFVVVVVVFSLYVRICCVCLSFRVHCVAESCTTASGAGDDRLEFLQMMDEFVRDWKKARDDNALLIR